MALRLSGDPHADIAALRIWLDASEPEPLVIETSGSTGAPKRALLSRDALLSSASGSTARLGALGPWLLALPSTYVAGVNVVVRSLLAGHLPVVVADQGGIAAAAVAMPGGFVSLVPTQLARLLEEPAGRAALSGLHTVLLGGGPVPPGLRERTADAGVRVVATYGSSETAGGCVYDGYPLEGVTVSLTPESRIRIAGPVLFDGYQDDPELTAQALGPDGFLTSDLGRLHPDGRLEVLGRADDVLITGGVKVPAPAVVRRLLEHPAVVAAEVVGIDDPEWGQAIVAVLATPGLASMSALTLGEVRDWVGGACPRPWAPRHLVVVDALPLLPNGKVDRLAVRALAEARR